MSRVNREAGIRDVSIDVEATGINTCLLLAFHKENNHPAIGFDHGLGCLSLRGWQKLSRTKTEKRTEHEREYCYPCQSNPPFFLYINYQTGFKNQ